MFNKKYETCPHCRGYNVERQWCDHCKGDGRVDVKAKVPVTLSKLKVSKSVIMKSNGYFLVI
jgi:DnaJ-class molecular chaperone